MALRFFQREMGAFKVEKYIANARAKGIQSFSAALYRVTGVTGVATCTKFGAKSIKIHLNPWTSALESLRQDRNRNERERDETILVCRHVNWGDSRPVVAQEKIPLANGTDDLEQRFHLLRSVGEECSLSWLFQSMYLSHDFVLACISFTNFIPVSIIYCILFFCKTGRRFLPCFTCLGSYFFVKWWAGWFC